MDIYKIIGLMSGTSLDGLDIVYCLLIHDKEWTFNIEKAETIAYDSRMRRKLQNATELDSKDLMQLHFHLGYYIGKQVKEFIASHHLQPDFIASHGHTIFHQPQKGYTLQIGNGNAISAECSLPVVYDFRSLDVALGGQGAPLVPIGDRLLFPEYVACINLGGIANISFERKQKRLAFDVCPMNMVLNRLASEKNLLYDDQGKMARSGCLIQPLLDRLNKLLFYQHPGPKSLGKEWVSRNVLPLLELKKYSVEDLLNTFGHHIAFQLAQTLHLVHPGKLLITGGGAYNEFVIGLLSEQIKHEVVIPSETLINYKEALIFALLGVLRLRGEVNTLASVTGAKSDSCGGIIAGRI